MDKKKILIISQAIFPAQFPRSYRATELAKELARKGHDVTLYAVLGKYDYSSFETKYNLKVKNIGRMWFATLNSTGNGRRNFIDKVLYKLFGRILEFPNVEFMYRIPHLLLNEKEIDLIISIAMPFPIHWGCALSKSISPKKFPKTWVADCGDPYMGNFFAPRKPLFYFKYIEKWFCKKADNITVPIEGAISGYYSEFHNKIKVIPQGFNLDNLNKKRKFHSNSIPTFAYSGVFYKGLRDPTSFLEYLIKIDKPFKFIVYTSGQSLITPFLNQLKGKLEIRPYVPRDELIRELKNMDFLVNFENGTKLQSPSKLIDYAITGRPILSIDSKSLPTSNIHHFLMGDYKDQFIVKNIEQYNIKNVAKHFLELSK